MKNSIKTAVLGLAALVSGFSACNDADYDTLGVHAFVSESASNKSTKVTITELGADAEITACLSEAATKDVKLKFVVDSEVLDRYNQKQASSFLVLPEEVYEMDSEVTIKAGEFSAPATKIHIKPLPKEYVGESYALPLRLVSADGSVPVTSVTSTYVITTEAIVVSSLPMFVGGAGKSAMFPLHIWLPDAMEGPTPVSALIHAATMVVAGVYLVARMFPLFIGYAPEVLHWTAYVGAFTAFYAAVVACVQSDIKRVLAFSTISQIGFMLVALGVSTSADPHAGGLGYMASMFHLFTHAMFKALLFLGAGCIIHAVHSNEMSAMGGLRCYMPLTHLTFLVACLAIAGIWPLSGFFSKDEILAGCFAFSPVMGWIMTVIAAMTAFYMFRLYYGIFWGTENKELHGELHMHEAPKVMTFPLIFLALVTCVAGFIPFGHLVSADGMSYDIHLNWTVAGTSIVIAVASIALATFIYKGEKQPVAVALASRFSSLHKWAYHRFYIDEVYQFVTHRIIFACISKPFAWFDKHVVDGILNGLASGSHRVSYLIRGFQSGEIQQYAYVFLVGALVLVLLLIL